MFLILTSTLIFINLYTWHRLKTAFFPRHTILAYVLLAIILLLPFTGFFMRRLSSIFGPYAMNISWTWLAWSFWLFCTFFTMDVMNIIIAYISHSLDKSKYIYPFISDTTKGYIAVGIIILASLYGLYEASHVRLRTCSLTSPAAPKAGYKIAFISDLHLGQAQSQAKIQRIIDQINQAKPDLVISAGDMIDGNGQRMEKLAAILNNLDAQSRVAVYGNHDVYTGLQFSRKMHDNTGFNLLENEAAQISDWLYIYGVTDEANGKYPPIPAPPPNTFSILLRHRPTIATDLNYTLQLSGHSHGGQIFPFNFLVRFKHPYKEGRLHTLPNGTQLYVSHGTGLWGPPFRLFAPPEITLITITPN